MSKRKLFITTFVLKDAHHSIIDGSEVIVDYYRQQLMPGWIPRRLGMYPVQVLAVQIGVAKSIHWASLVQLLLISASHFFFLKIC